MIVVYSKREIELDFDMRILRSTHIDKSGCWINTCETMYLTLLWISKQGSPTLSVASVLGFFSFLVCFPSELIQPVKLKSNTDPESLLYTSSLPPPP